MSRTAQTCVECSRRKIKCQKIIPCDNCIKRGTAQLCRRVDVTSHHQRQVSQLSDPLSTDASKNGLPETLLNEKILRVITSLSDRVEQIETKLNGHTSVKRFRSTQGDDSSIVEEYGTLEMTGRPLKHPRPSRHCSGLSLLTSSTDSLSASTVHDNTNAESDAEIGDAATVLEFLAWGRLKDSDITDGLRESSSTRDTMIDNDSDDPQLLTSSVSGNKSLYFLHMSHIQDLLPEQAQTFMLFEYHADWLLFMHCSFHAQTFRRELEKFYLQDDGKIIMTSSGLQWTALLFALMCGSLVAAKPAQVRAWGLSQGQKFLAENWYRASIECLNAARYQQNHSLHSIQTIASSTICAHVLGFSSSHSVLLASAVRIAQSLGLHRLAQAKRPSHKTKDHDLADMTQREVGRRVWQQLVTQDWFAVPFSESYSVNPLHHATKLPLHCDEENMQPVAISMPTISSYGNFLYKIANLMPALLDQLSRAQSLEAKYQEVLRFDQMMRDLVVSELPPCLNSQTPIDPHWPQWVLLARRCLTVTSAHKIIMIHRNFLGMSFHDRKYSFTRRTCLAAAKTIIHEVKQTLPEDSPSVWTMQAFSVAAAIILSLENFSAKLSARERTDNRALILDAISFLSSSTSVSSIVARGIRLLSDLSTEEKRLTGQHDAGVVCSTEIEQDRGSGISKKSDRSLDVAAFVRKFCESDHPLRAPIAPQMPLWLQDSSVYLHSEVPEESQYLTHLGSQRDFALSSMKMPPERAAYDMLNTRDARHQSRTSDSFVEAFSEAFDVRSVNWFDDLLGLAPTHSI